ncbi:unnamed protein product, partial [Onchocerca ochengi]
AIVPKLLGQLGKRPRAWTIVFFRTYRDREGKREEDEHVSEHGPHSLH